MKICNLLLRRRLLKLSTVTAETIQTPVEELMHQEGIMLAWSQYNYGNTTCMPPYSRRQAVAGDVVLANIRSSDDENGIEFDMYLEYAESMVFNFNQQDLLQAVMVSTCTN